MVPLKWENGEWVTNIPVKANSQTRFFMFLISQVSLYTNYFIKAKESICFTPIHLPEDENGRRTQQKYTERTGQGQGIWHFSAIC